MIEYRGKIPYVLKEYKENIIYLCSSNRNIEDYYQVLVDIYDGNILKIENTGEEEDFLKSNYDFLKIIKSNEKFIILLSLESFLDDYFLEGEEIEIKLGKKINIKDIEKKLEEDGYKKEYIITQKKEYSIRGDIIDIFPVDSDYPVRIEIGFDNEIERVAYFDLESQKSIEKKDVINMYINNNKNKKSFFSIIKQLDKIKVFIENKELLNYKLEEIILRNRDREDIFRNRYDEIKKIGIDIETIKFSNNEIDNFSDYDYIKEKLKNDNLKIIIRSEEDKRYKEIFKGYPNITYERYPLFEGYKEGKIIVLTDRELKGIRVKRKTKESKALKYKDVSEIREGDYIIHENYGIGLYIGIEIINGNEYLKIKYADEDKLYVPVEGIGRIEKYISHEDNIPELYTLGRRGFKRRKEKLYKEMLEFAKEIIKIQAKRELNIGYKFSCDTVWQEEFEEGFLYNETPSQKQAIIDVKNDMESSRVMDRVVCGDVGYGKTEVAMRAAFKAAIDGKQVAILVPTTVLAQQHFNRFSERMKNYPISIELVSRLKTIKEQKEVNKKIAQGSIDIVIGTHRILSKDIKFKDLGLVIIDEEQKFGVSAKEKLKKYRANVDMLTLTATPIPRTLNLSLLGIRDLSVIDTPPEGRKAVKSYFITGEESEIKKIIMKEIAREGQIFYIYNHVNGIPKKVRELEKILPSYVNVEYVHGQMLPKDIKEKIMKFENGDIDLLVSTTIIENGIDIENANTMIIDGIEKLGLSQIYQLRGRIGRGKRQAYCYLLLKETRGKRAKEREESLIKLESEGGGGLQLSLEDMRIRGVGEILGERQHGALETFGYNLYMKMLQEEIKKQKGEYISNKSFEDIDIKVNYLAFIPDDYIEKNQKIKIYRDIVNITSLEELEEYKKTLVDIYGKMPIEVKGLFKYINIKFRARKIGIKKGYEDKGYCYINFEKERVNLEILTSLIQDKKLVYNNREEMIEYKGSIEEFLNLYENYEKINNK